MFAYSEIFSNSWVFIYNSLHTADKLKITSFEGKLLFFQQGKAGASGHINTSLAHLGLIFFYKRTTLDLKQHNQGVSVLIPELHSLDTSVYDFYRGSWVSGKWH